jgi:Uma2 family endonuclease
MEPLRKGIRYTYEDYLSWNDGARYELIDGIAYMMSPAPNRAHQEISGELNRQLSNFLKGKKCKAYAAPFDVRLSGEDDKATVVQPDITVVCDPSKLDKKGCNGAPDMVVEILSPSSSERDTVLKLNQYLKARVREFWIIDPENKVLAVHILNGDAYSTKTYSDAGRVPVRVLEGCEIDLDEVFAGLTDEEEEIRAPK